MQDVLVFLRKEYEKLNELYRNECKYRMALELEGLDPDKFVEEVNRKCKSV